MSAGAVAAAERLSVGFYALLGALNLAVAHYMPASAPG